MVCSQDRAKQSAFNQANVLGATHIIWTDSRCVVGVGWKTSARIYDCEAETSLAEVFEDYLSRSPDLRKNTQPALESPQILRTSDPDGDGEDLALRGFALVGFAGVEGSAISLDEIRSRAAAIRAAVVLVHSRAAGVDVEYQAVTRYTRGSPGYVHTNAHAGVQGRGSGAVGSTPFWWNSSVYGTGNSTSLIVPPGETRTEYVPFSQRRYDTQVMFWRKRRPGPLGLYVSRIPVGMRAKLERNTGVYVLAVEEDSRAFFANVLPGDIVIGIDGEGVRTPDDLSSLGAKAVLLEVLRQGRRVKIEVRP
jgi:hypothetical protein